MKSLLTFVLLMTVTLSIGSISKATDYGDKNCNIFVVQAGNVITGGQGVFLSAVVAVSKNLINQDFKNYKVSILGSENIAPTRVTENGGYLVYTYDRYTKGIDYSKGVAFVTVSISNGIDRLYDNNDYVLLNGDHNWQYTNQRCQVR